MATNFQSAVTSILMKFFSIFFLHFACVKNGKKLWKKFFHFGSRWCHLPKGLDKNCFSVITSELSNFFQSVFCISFVLSARTFNGRKVFDKIKVGGLLLIFLFQQFCLLKKSMFNCSFVAYRKIAAYECKNFLVFQNVILWKT
jgi:hypothetical protein